ncbi:hypothetical protein DOK67_0001860 [Enterococcus sp. DIV0212c]|nr:hypothetical protein [Enterococcus sp. DIV0212c]
MMRLTKVISLFKLFYLFFVRKVTNIGLLKKKMFRVLLLFIIVSLVSVVTIGIYLFLNEIGNQKLQAELILDVYTGNILMWTSIIFIFLKVLFMKSNQFLQMTFQLPVKNQERNTALLLFELVLSMICILLVSSGVVIAFIMKYQWIYIAKIFANVFFTSITIYLILQLIFSLLSWCVIVLHLQKFKTLIQFFSLLSIVAIFFVCYPIVIDNMLINYLDKIRNENVLLGYSFILKQTNFFVTSLVFLLISFCLAVGILFIPNNEYITDNKNLPLKIKINKVNMFKLYFLCLYRNIENYSYMMISLTIYLYLLLFTNIQASLAFLIPTIVGIYLFIQTENIRWYYSKKEYNVFWDYFNLIFSQYLFLSIVSSPFVLVELLFKKNVKEIFSFCFVLFLSILLFTLIGILFPPKRENPFSVFVGFVVVITITFVLAVILLIFNWSAIVNGLIMLLLIIITIYYSLNGLKKLQEDIRHGKN